MMPDRIVRRLPLLAGLACAICAAPAVARQAERALPPRDPAAVPAAVAKPGEGASAQAGIIVVGGRAEDRAAAADQVLLNPQPLPPRPQSDGPAPDLHPILHADPRAAAARTGIIVVGGRSRDPAAEPLVAVPAATHRDPADASVPAVPARQLQKVAERDE